MTEADTQETSAGEPRATAAERLAPEEIVAHGFALGFAALALLQRL